MNIVRDKMCTGKTVSNVCTYTKYCYTKGHLNNATESTNNKLEKWTHMHTYLFLLSK